MLPEIPSEQYAAALDETIDEMLTTARIERPPVNPLQLAEALGIVVARDDRQTGRGRYVRLRAFAGRGTAAADSEDRLVVEPPTQASILLRDDPRQERRHWALAHELGEHAAVHVFHRLGVDPREAPAAARESIANHLASRLLLPAAWLARDAGECGWDLFALKRRYATASHELIARRMLDFDLPVVVTICDQGQVSFRRGAFGRRGPPMNTLEHACWQRVHRRGCMAQDQHDALLVRCWPIHERGWKREILRTELSEASAA
ncbi:MAG TPA: ImmA/IrrE family metallo-endopeptidase [Pirellulales bacterium]|jgi:hypothetical protein|nr:ImmA/IrrE family metallo-endopeptidase [Pirellulales bacterium]